jgi:hypothetical protein
LWSGKWQGKTEVGRNIATATLSTINPTWTTVGTNPAAKHLELQKIIRAVQCVM